MASFPTQPAKFSSKYVMSMTTSGLRPATSAFFSAQAERRPHAMDTNAEMVSLLKNLTKRFDSLQKEVETLKEKEAHRSASRSEVESSEADGATVPENEHSENAWWGRSTSGKASPGYSRRSHPLKVGKHPQAERSERLDH